MVVHKREAATTQICPLGNVHGVLLRKIYVSVEWRTHAVKGIA